MHVVLDNQPKLYFGASSFLHLGTHDDRSYKSYIGLQVGKPVMSGTAKSMVKRDGWAHQLFAALLVYSYFDLYPIVAESGNRTVEIEHIVRF